MWLKRTLYSLTLSIKSFETKKQILLASRLFSLSFFSTKDHIFISVYIMFLEYSPAKKYLATLVNLFRFQCSYLHNKANGTKLFYQGCLIKYIFGIAQTLRISARIFKIKFSMCTENGFIRHCLKITFQRGEHLHYQQTFQNKYRIKIVMIAVNILFGIDKIGKYFKTSPVIF